MLWNDTCSGNKSFALLQFFGGGTDAVGTLPILEENSCFVNSSLNCTGFESANTLSEFKIIRDWMRSPQCLSSSSEWRILQAQTQLPAHQGLTCCSFCYIAAQNVDVYYWPEPGSDTSCLSIVGNVTDPPLFGATSGFHEAHWGCTASDGQYVTTAILSSIGPISFKESLFNPWSSQPCSIEVTPATATVEPRNFPARVQVRGHSLLLPSNVTHSMGSPANTAVVDGFTL